MIVIGIDCGVKTGMAVYDLNEKEIKLCVTCQIHNAFEYITNFNKERIKMVIVEDARLVRFKTSPLKAQGAGSVKRDAKIWEDFLLDKKIPFRMVRPNKKFTKINKDLFKKITGIYHSTSTHSRDAMMLIFSNFNI